MRYAVCDPTEVPELCRMLALTFTKRDPPAVAVGLTPDEFEAFVALVAAPEATQALTVVARDLASGVLAGALLTEDAASPPPDELAELSERFDPIFDLFGRLDAQLAESHVSEPGVVLHLFLLGVDGRFAGRGIAQRLIQASLAHCSAMGYRTAITEATNGTSQHVFRKAGFTTRAEASYADYRRDGVAVFASISEHGGLAAMMRELGPAGGPTLETPRSGDHAPTLPAPATPSPAWGETTELLVDKEDMSGRQSTGKRRRHLAAGAPMGPSSPGERSSGRS